MNQQYLRIHSNNITEKGHALYSKCILRKQEVEGLLSYNERNIDGQAYHYYFIEGLHSMQDSWSDIFLSKNEMISFIECLSNTLEALDCFLLKQEQIVLDPSYIMYDSKRGCWRFLYLVEPYEEQGEDILTLMDFWLSRLGGVEEKDDWFYEYYTSIMQYGRSIRPLELVGEWDKQKRECCIEVEEPRREEKEETRAERNLDLKEIDVEAPDFEKIPLKKRVNLALYAKLYMVPFRPA